MSRAWGEASWTARDVPQEWIITDALGGLHGRFDTEDEAHDARAQLGEWGLECWVVGVTGLEVE